MTDSDCTKRMLNDLQIASPCLVPWKSMDETASEAVRFCGQCSKNVYDISKLTTLRPLCCFSKAQHQALCPACTVSTL
jgi:hypothetical protein